MIVVDRGAGRVERNPNEAANRLFERVVAGVDDIDAGIGAISEVVLRSFGIDPTDVEGADRITWYGDRRQAFGFGCSGRAGSRARTRTRGRRGGCQNRHNK